MFSGIIETLGVVQKISSNKSNFIITVFANFVEELKINQSISHNGICLTVIELHDASYNVCVVNETIQATNIKTLKKGDLINLERCLILGDRIDGHIVQGHVDYVAKCVEIKDLNGSWICKFRYFSEYSKYLVPKGSVAINGVSLTIAKIDEKNQTFSVSIIPYTFEKTNFHKLRESDLVNVEFDIFNKQIAKMYFQQ